MNIIDPITKQSYSVRSIIGKNILKKYIEIYNSLGGESDYGPYYNDRTPLKNLASYWWNTLGKCCWWSSGQDGYYFTNAHNRYMSTTHVHIYKGKYDRETRRWIYFYTTKYDNVRLAPAHGKILSFSVKNLVEAGKILTILCFKTFRGKKP